MRICARTIIGRPVDYTPGGGYIGATQHAAARAGRRSHRRSAGVERRHRQARVDAHFDSPNWGPMLATGGGLVFSGGTNDRKFHAFDATTGALLWEFPTNSGIIGQPSSFTVDGKQYVAVQSGWGVDSRAMQSRLSRLAPGKFPEVPEGGAVWVFAVR